MLRLCRTLIPIVVTLLAGASTSRAVAQTGSPTVILPGFRSVVRMDTVGTPEVLPGTPGAAYAALAAAFDSLGIERPISDAAAGYVGNMGLKVTRRFLGQSLSHWVDCGIGPTGPTANLYRIHLSILAMVRRGTDGATELRPAVAAGAQAYSGPLGDPIACQSTGALERRIIELVRARLRSS